MTTAAAPAAAARIAVGTPADPSGDECAVTIQRDYYTAEDTGGGAGMYSSAAGWWLLTSSSGRPVPPADGHVRA